MEPNDDPQSSPNSYEMRALQTWLPRMEHFQRRNIQRFDSIDHLFQQLVDLKRDEVQAAMHEENLVRRKKAQDIWQQAIARSWQQAAPSRARASSDAAAHS